MDALAGYALAKRNVFATIESGMTALDKDAFIQCDKKESFFLLCHVKFCRVQRDGLYFLIESALPKTFILQTETLCVL